MKHYLVTAVPHQGFDAYFRAGVRWTETPQEITVLDDEPAEDAPPRGTYELTPKQFAQLKADRRIRIETASGRPVNEAAKEALAAERDAEKAAAGEKPPHPKK